ncbi:MAG: hypothetical protein AAF487_04610 [Bacteroidota bacterium]
MHYLIQLITLFFFLVSCSNKDVQQGYNLEQADEISNCILNDTVFEYRNIEGFVRYFPIDSVFNIRIGLGDWNKELNYRFDCSAPNAIVPRYEWNNNEVVALIRGCGSYCSKHLFFLNKGNSSIERENVLAKDIDRSLICYTNTTVDGVFLIVENILTENFLSVEIKELAPCDFVEECIDGIDFFSNEISVEYQSANNGVMQNIIIDLSDLI